MTNLNDYRLKEQELKIVSQLKQARKQHGFSQRGLCAILNMQQPSLVKIEKGMISPQLNTILKLLEPLGLTLEVVEIDKNSEIVL